MIIGLFGVKRSGKSSTFNFIKKRYPDIEEITIAGPLKEACSKAFDIPYNVFESQVTKEKPFDIPVFLNETRLRRIFKFYDLEYVPGNTFKVFKTPREILQYIGTDVLRALIPSIHCDASIKGKKLEQAIVTDIRFPNEFKFFQDMGIFTPLYIERKEAEEEAKKDLHVSESHILEMSKYPGVIRINSNGSLKELEISVVETLERIGF